MFKIPLQFKVTLLFILILVVSISGIYFYYLPEVEEKISGQAKDNLENIAINTAGYITHLVMDDVNKIEILAKNPVLRSPNISSSVKMDEILTYREHYHTFDEITLLDTKGIVVASTDYNYRGEWKTKAWYQDSLDGEVVVTDAHIILDPWKLVILILSPIRDTTGSTIGVVSGQIDLESYWSLIDSIEIGETGQIRIINDNAKILYHLNRSKLFSKVSSTSPFYSLDPLGYGSLEYDGSCNTSFFCGYSTVLDDTLFQNGSWHLLVSRQKSELLAGLSTFRYNVFQGSVIFCGILFLLGYLFSRGVVKPVLKIHKGMQELSKGNFGHAVEVKGNSELSMLSRSFNLLGARLKQLTEKLEERNQLVEILLKQKDEFINQLGHDLKNPLGPLLSLVPLLKKHEQDPKYQEMLEVIERNTMYMKNLVSKTLTLARLSSPNTQFYFKHANLEEIIRGVVDMNKMLFSEKHIDVSLDVPSSLTVPIDTMQFEELLTNLLNNAVKFSTDPGSIHVAVQEAEDMVTISIADTGIGMSKEQLSQVFDEFYKADPSRHDFDSSGLGMSIAKRIVEKHGGRIWAESLGPGKGSTFYFTIAKYQNNTSMLDTQKAIVDVDIGEKIDVLLQTQ
jgi:signal transduction histidine kinase